MEFQIIRTANDFSQSLLDILESQVMKRMSINHCVEVDAYKHENVSRVQITSADISGSKTSQCEVLQSCEPEFNYRMRTKRTSADLLMSFFVSCVVEFTIAEMACVSSNVRRTFHVPSGVRVQRSISERDCSQP